MLLQMWLAFIWTLENDESMYPLSNICNDAWLHLIQTNYIRSMHGLAKLPCWNLLQFFPFVFHIYCVLKLYICFPKIVFDYTLIELCAEYLNADHVYVHDSVYGMHDPICIIYILFTIHITFHYCGWHKRIHLCIMVPYNSLSVTRYIDTCCVRTDE